MFPARRIILDNLSTCSGYHGARTFFRTGLLRRDPAERGSVDEADGGGGGSRIEGRRNCCAIRHVRLSSALYIRSGIGPCDTRSRTRNNGRLVLNCVSRRVRRKFDISRSHLPFSRAENSLRLFVSLSISQRYDLHHCVHHFIYIKFSTV